MRYAVALLTAVALASAGWASEVPRSARLVKDAGNQFLSAKKYADAIDCYFQALDLFPEFPEAHYNLGVAFLRGYNASGLALHHFQQYLALDPDAADRDSVAALIEALRERAPAVRSPAGFVLGLVAGRLLVSGGDWLAPGDRVEVFEEGGAPCACLLAEYVYPDMALTQRIWDDGTLNQMREGLLAVNTSEGAYPR